MNKMMASAMVLMMMGVLAGCTSDHILHMRDGSTVVVEGKPHLDNATKMLIYTDATGRTQAVNLDEVQGMSRLKN
ncbi:YgdI/YgdR family lipoprotein [Pantoea agglomerans]|uniref:YgdI/YgdR family lipoprotein n=1 Tax=Enterobacter agglomerans TaxID=549 RepID=A0ACC5RTD7_ENTAG|nr:YgdI/YgdR family lipoprotein [Pantoea agglomerans]MBK4727986.1 YgdI/YgdR family lipoprotein [Pantoea agglomerans]